jgi:hypothetical protein
MTTLYVRDQSGFREADASDVCDRAQELITRRPKEALALIDVRALDHVTVAESI